MSNTYFQFKRFRIEQHLAGMKVTTDGCLFGALIEADEEGAILDIGTGTGLLALMLAQKTDSSIDAIEINNEVAKQAQNNIDASPWASQITVFNKSLQEFEPNKTYKQIISNPPFFKNNFKGGSISKNIAIHDDLLPMDLLLKQVKSFLHQNGSFWVMYPAYEMELFEKKATEKGFFLRDKISVYNRPGSRIFRVITCFVKSKAINPSNQTINIKGNGDTYSPTFTSLLKDYYLHL